MTFELHIIIEGFSVKSGNSDASAHALQVGLSEMRIYTCICVTGRLETKACLSIGSERSSAEASYSLMQQYLESSSSCSSLSTSGPSHELA